MVARLLAFLLFAALVSTAQAIPKRERFLSYDSDITINADRTVRVVETMRVESTGATIMHGVVRGFPTMYRSFWVQHSVPLTVESATIDGKPTLWSVRESGNGVYIQIGDPKVYLAYAEHTITLTYTTDWQIGFFEAGDEFTWNVTPFDNPYPIEQASATIRLPPGARATAMWLATGRAGAKSADGTIAESEPGIIRAETSRVLGPDEGLTVAVQWPKGFVTPPSFFMRAGRFIMDARLTAFIMPGFALAFLSGAFMVWNVMGPGARRSRPSRLFPVAGFIFAGSILLALGSAGYHVANRGEKREPIATSSPVKDEPGFEWARLVPGLLIGLGFSGGALLVLVGGWLVAGRDPRRGTIIPLFEPPDGLEAVEARYITRYRYDRKVFATALLDLAAKHAMKIESKSASVFILQPVEAPPDLPRFGALAFRQLFPNGVTLRMGSSYEKLIGDAALVLQQQLAARHHGPSFRANRPVLVIAAVILGAGALAAFALNMMPVALLGLVPGIIAMRIFASLIPAVTSSARHIRDHLLGFRMYLETAEKDRFELLNPPELTPALFEAYLPWATALDVEHSWSAAFAARIRMLPPEQRAAFEDEYISERFFDRRSASSIADLSQSIASASRAPGTSSSFGSSDSGFGGGSSGGSSGGSAGSGGGGGSVRGW